MCQRFRHRIQDIFEPTTPIPVPTVSKKPWAMNLQNNFLEKKIKMYDVYTVDCHDMPTRVTYLKSAQGLKEGELRPDTHNQRCHGDISIAALFYISQIIYRCYFCVSFV